MSAVPSEALSPALLSSTRERVMLRLVDVPLREEVELVDIDLPSDEAESLMERGVLPGCRLCPIRRSPFGDPIISVDGALLALRRETARCLCVRRGALGDG